MGRLNYKGLPYYTSTTRNIDKLTGKTRTFGSYTVAIDTTEPEIKPINFHEGNGLATKFSKVKITDDLSGISSYREPSTENSF